jgi:hypothetical protein
MKSPITWNTDLSRSTANVPQPRNTRSFHSEVYGLWQTIVAHAVGTFEPRVWQTQDENGRSQWNAYDPRSQQTLRQVSSQDLRIWLEHRHDLI